MFWLVGCLLLLVVLLFINIVDVELFRSLFNKTRTSMRWDACCIERTVSRFLCKVTLHFIVWKRACGRTHTLTRSFECLLACSWCYCTLISYTEWKCLFPTIQSVHECRRDDQSKAKPVKIATKIKSIACDRTAVTNLTMLLCINRNNRYSFFGAGY